MTLKRPQVAPGAAVLALLVSSCGSPADDLEGAWVTASMRDGLECQMGRVMIVQGDTVIFGLAGREIRSYAGLESEATESGSVILKSDVAKFEFVPGEEPGTMTLVEGPTVANHHTARMPKELARC